MVLTRIALSIGLFVGCYCGCDGQSEADRIFRERHAGPLELTSPPAAGAVNRYELVRRLSDKNLGDSAEFATTVEATVLEHLPEGEFRVRCKYGTFHSHEAVRWQLHLGTYNLVAEIPLEARFGRDGRLIRLENFDAVRKQAEARLAEQLHAVRNVDGREVWEELAAEVRGYHFGNFKTFLAETAFELQPLWSAYGRTYLFDQPLEEDVQRYPDRPSDHPLSHVLCYDRFVLTGFKGRLCETAVIEHRQTTDVALAFEYFKKNIPEADYTRIVAMKPTDILPDVTTVEIDVATRKPVKLTFVRESGSTLQRRTSASTLTLIGRP